MRAKTENMDMDTEQIRSRLDKNFGTGRSRLPACPLRARCLPLLFLSLASAFLLLVPATASGELPPEDADLPLTPVLVGNRQVEQAARRLADGGPRAVRNAERMLERTLRGRDKEAQLAAALVLAAHCRRAGRIPAAAKLVEEYSKLRPANLQPRRLEAFLEYARCEAAGGRTLSAFRALDYARQKTEGLEAALVRIAYADVAEMVPDYPKAAKWLREAAGIGNRWAKPPAISETDRPEPPEGAKMWPPLRSAIQRRLKVLEFRIAERKWGRGYVRYLYAQKSRGAGHPLARDFTDTADIYPTSGSTRARIPGAEFEDAVALYDRLIEDEPDTVFAEAARVYRSVCLVHLDRSREAERDLKRFVSESALGLYRGEAMLTLGDIQLQKRWQPSRARRRYRTALDWCRQAEAVKQGARLYAVPEKAAKPASAPGSWHRMKRGGVIERLEIPPGAVVNRLTAPWYLDWLQAELLFRLGFLEALGGDWDAALARWRKVEEHDKLLKRARKKRYYYGRAGQSGQGKDDKLLAQGRKIGEMVLERFPDAPAAPHCAFMIAYSTSTGTAEEKAASKAAFKRMREEYPRSRHVAEARFREIFTVIGPSLDYS